MTHPPSVEARTPAPGAARWWASVWDYVVIVSWLAALTIVGFAVRAWLPPAAATPALLATDAVAFGFSVLPVWAYLTVTEAGARQASWGKRRVGLRVDASDGGRPSWGRVAGRNAVKLLPWELAHIAVARLILGVDDPVTIGATYTLSLLIPVVSITMAGRDQQRRALHDRIAGTRVVLAQFK